MTIYAIAIRLLSYFAYEERSIPDHADYPGRNGAVLGAMNAALQKMFSGQYPWVANKPVGVRLNAPISLVLLPPPNLSSYDATLPPNIPQWIVGCTMAIEGESADNKINLRDEDDLRLMIPKPAGLVPARNATVYHDSVVIPLTAAAVRSPVMIDGRIIAESNTQNPRASMRSHRRSDYGAYDPAIRQERASQVAGEVICYRVVALGDGTAPAQNRIELYPPPAKGCILTFQTLNVPERVTALDSTGILPIPLGYVDSIFIPLCLEALADSPWFNAQVPNLANSIAEAKRLLKQLDPASHRSVRLVPIG